MEAANRAQTRLHLRAIANVPEIRRIGAKHEVKGGRGLKDEQPTIGAQAERPKAIARRNTSRMEVDCDPRPSVSHVVEEKLPKRTLPARSAICGPEALQHPEVRGFEREIQCVEFVDDIYCYMLKSEDSHSLEIDFMDGCKVLTPKMRSILVDWMSQVQGRFSLLPETLSHAVYYVDAVLSAIEVEKTELQLLGIAALFVASKFEEMFAPEVSELEFVSDNTYKKKDIFRMEQKILMTIGFELNRPPPFMFLRSIFHRMKLDTGRVYSVAKYICELCLVDYEVAHFPPSRIAAASVLNAHKLMDEHLNVATILQLVDCTPDELDFVTKEVAKAVLRVHASKRFMSMQNKYSTNKFFAASKWTPEEMDRLRRISE